MTGAIPVEMLMQAYRQGCFPMADAAEDDEVQWVRPEVRGILPLDGFRVPARLARTVRRDEWTVTADRAFGQVIARCAEAAPDREQTWINAAIRDACCRLHDLGRAHSVEVWDGAKLVGGLYGLRLGGAFFGESMFSRARDASKAALVHLVARLNRAGFVLLDAQFVNPHLDQFGAEAVPHRHYMHRLESALAIEPDMDGFRDSMTGDQAVAYARQPTTQAS